jgi:hypothetical protein
VSYGIQPIRIKKYLRIIFFQGEKMPSKLKIILSSLVFVLGSMTIVKAEELNMPGFNGTINTTVTTGLSVRIERDCLSEPGQIHMAGDTTYASAINTLYSGAADRAAFLAEGPGCARQYTDGYGNTPDTTSGGMRKLINSNANDGNMNFYGNYGLWS